jgi:hypothetical protein
VNIVTGAIRGRSRHRKEIATETQQVRAVSTQRVAPGRHAGTHVGSAHTDHEPGLKIRLPPRVAADRDRLPLAPTPLFKRKQETAQAATRHRRNVCGDKSAPPHEVALGQGTNALAIRVGPGRRHWR